MAVDEAHEAGAVEAVARRRTAPCVRNSPEPPGVVHDPHPERVPAMHDVMVVAPLVPMLVRVLLRRDHGVARDARQWHKERHEKGAREYEQQYEKAEWPHWKLEGLPSRDAADYPAAARCRRGLVSGKQRSVRPAMTRLGDKPIPLCSNRQV